MEHCLCISGNRQQVKCISLIEFTDLLMAVGIFQPVCPLQGLEPEIHGSSWPCIAGKKVSTRGILINLIYCQLT